MVISIAYYSLINPYFRYAPFCFTVLITNKNSSIKLKKGKAHRSMFLCVGRKT